MISPLLLLAAVLAAELPPAAALEAVTLPPVVERTLPGGAQLWALERPGPLAELELLWTLPPDDLDARAVLAQRLLAALLEGEVDEATLDRLGAVLDVGRTATGLRLRLQVPAAGLDEALTLLAPVLQQPRLPRPAVRHVRRSWRAQERRAPQSAARVAERADLRASLPAGHPLTLLPGLADGRGLGRHELRAAHQRLLAEGGATVVLTGGEPAMLPPHLGFLRAPPDAPAQRPAPVPTPGGPRVVLVQQAGSRQARVLLSFPLPQDLPPAHAELLAQTLGGGAAGLLDRRLRGEQALVYGVAVEVQRWAHGGRLRLDTRMAAADLPAGLTALQTCLASAGTEAGAEERARATALFSAARAMDSLPLLGAALATRAARAEPPAAWQHELDALAALPEGALLAAASAVLRPEAATWVILGDRDTLEPLLESAGLPPTALWSAARAAGAPR